MTESGKKAKKLRGKALCKWKKNAYEKHADILAELVEDAQFICKRCGRAAASAKNLCKPMRIETIRKDSNVENETD